MFHAIIATCAILTVMAIYRVPMTRDTFRSFLLGGALVLVLWIGLIIAGST